MSGIITSNIARIGFNHKYFWVEAHYSDAHGIKQFSNLSRKHPDAQKACRTPLFYDPWMGLSFRERLTCDVQKVCWDVFLYE